MPNTVYRDLHPSYRDKPSPGLHTERSVHFLRSSKADWALLVRVQVTYSCPDGLSLQCTDSGEYVTNSSPLKRITILQLQQSDQREIMYDFRTPTGGYILEAP